jgi:RNA polymerase sigma-70 factor (ECF subfamily)
MVFDEIYHTYWNKVFRICMGYVNDHDWAKDIAQETFVTVWQALPKFRNESSVGTWIFRIASNHCLRQIERQNRMPRSDMPEQMADHIEPDTEPQVQFYINALPNCPKPTA